MRTVINQLLALGMCFGLFAVTCPLAGQATATPPPAEQKCCAKAEAAQGCCGTERGESEPSGCCISHCCGNVISVASAPVSAFRGDAPRFLFTYTQRISVRAHAPPVPPPRVPLA